MILLSAFLFTAKMGDFYSRGWVGIWGITGLSFLMTERIILRIFLRILRNKGFNQRNVLIVGMSGFMEMLMGKVSQMSWAGFKIIGIFSFESQKNDNLSHYAPVLKEWKEVLLTIQNGAVDQIWIVMPLKEEDVLRFILQELRHSTIDIRFFPDLFGFRLFNHSISEIAGFPVINLSVSPMEGINRFVKALEDRLFSAIFLLVALPIMALIAIGVRLSSPGPIFYRQERIGWNGVAFEILKFRTMPENLEDSGIKWGDKYKEPTKFGKFLRKTSLDELPQFINVLRGEMSVVGPRPERPIFVDKFKDEVPGYMQKHLVKAGMTGWAQINGWRGDTDLSKRIEYDLFYIENWSIWFDIKIILLTVFKGFWNNHS